MAKQTVNEQTSGDFEEKLEKLRGIVDKLESDVSLEEGMRLFESGLALTRECLGKLDSAQVEIDELKGQLDLILEKSV